MATKAFLRSLKKDQIHHGRVEMLISSTEIVCNIEGNLIQVENHTGQLFKLGSEIQLQVDSVEPLQLSLFNERKFRRVV